MIRFVNAETGQKLWEWSDPEANPLPETLASDGKNVYVQIDQGVACLDLNTSAWDTPAEVTYNGVDMRRVPTPIRHSAVANEIAYCYEHPIVTDTMERTYFTLDADDTNNPANDDTVLLYAANFYIDAETGELAWGVEDEDGNVAGTDAADSVTIDIS